MGILKNKFFIIGNILLLLAVVPITLYVVKRQTDIRSKAAPTSVLSFTPSSSSTTVGQTVKFDIMVDPGQNVISIVEMVIQVDPDKLQIVSLDRNATAFSSLLKPATINNDGTVSISLSTSAEASKAIQAPTKVATLTVKAKTATTGAPTIIKFNKDPLTRAFSTATSDGPTENILSSTGTTSVTIAGGGNSGGGGGTKPTCSAINLDKAAVGTVPYSIMFSGLGTSSTGTISKASFNFGDGVSQDVTSGGGIGTNSVNAQISHTYANPGVFNPSVTFTNNTGGVSDVGACTVPITISALTSPTPISTDSAQISLTPTPTLIVFVPTATPSAAIDEPTPTLPITGSIQTTLTILGVAGATIGLGLLLFLL